MAPRVDNVDKVEILNSKGYAQLLQTFFFQTATALDCNQSIWLMKYFSTRNRSYQWRAHGRSNLKIYRCKKKGFISSVQMGEVRIYRARMMLYGKCKTKLWFIVCIVALLGSKLQLYAEFCSHFRQKPMPSRASGGELSKSKLCTFSSRLKKTGSQKKLWAWAWMFKLSTDVV